MELIFVNLTGGSSPMTKMRGLFGKRNVFASLGLGLLWGFSLCGLVFAMLVTAARTESLSGGALIVFTVSKTGAHKEVSA